MREIKFRIWDLSYDDEGEEVGRMWCLEHDGDGLGDYIPLKHIQDVGKEGRAMQYTGLKDKNGVEIYEGDILDFCGNKPVVFSFGSFVIETNRSEYTLSDLIGSHEVVGNIYENKELLL